MLFSSFRWQDKSSQPSKEGKLPYRTNPYHLTSTVIKELIFTYRRIFILLFILVTVLILVGMLYPSKHLSPINFWEYDKVWHFILFMIWTILYGLVQAIRKKQAPNVWFIFTFGLTYGLFIEFLQFIFPTNRSPELADFIADALGSLSAVFVLKWIFKPPIN